MKLTPCSFAFAIILPAVASSVGPPNIMVPRQSGETFTPDDPRLRCCMDFPERFPLSRLPSSAGLTLAPNRNIAGTLKFDQRVIAWQGSYIRPQAGRTCSLDLRRKPNRTKYSAA